MGHVDKRSIMLSPELAAAVDDVVAAGEYASRVHRAKTLRPASVIRSLANTSPCIVSAKRRSKSFACCTAGARAMPTI